MPKTRAKGGNPSKDLKDQHKKQSQSGLPRTTKVNKPKNSGKTPTKTPNKRRVVSKNEITDGNNNARLAKMPKIKEQTLNKDEICNEDEHLFVSASQNLEEFEDDHVKIVVDAGEDPFIDQEYEMMQNKTQGNSTETFVEPSVMGTQNTPAPMKGKVFDAQEVLVQSPELQQLFQTMLERGVRNALDQQQGGPNGTHEGNQEGPAARITMTPQGRQGTRTISQIKSLIQLFMHRLLI